LPKKLNLSAVAALANLIGIGFAIACVALPAGGGLSDGAQSVAGIGIMMAVLWITEAIPLAATALLPLVLFPLVGVASVDDLSSSYANPVIFLFLGGFLIARAIERWGLHRRLAFSILVRAGGDPKRIILSVMLVTAFLSLWISNTAAAMVAAPIAASVAVSRSVNDDFAPALMLGVAYAATIGGMGSLIGTPPNALFAAYMENAYGIVIGFGEWMLIGIPTVVILLPVTWLTLTRLVFRIEPDRADMALERLPGMAAAEIRVAIVAACTALLWILRPVISVYLPGLGLSDAGIAMTGAVVLFFLPAGGGQETRLLDWDTASTVRWDVLILFGGGLALASAITSTGLALWIGHEAEKMQGLPVFWIMVATAVIVVYLGELASNTCMAAIFLPVAGATAIGIGVDPLAFTLPVALAASIGFMLPVATPPNAIVFTNPAVDRTIMLRAGTPLDIVGIVVTLAIGVFLGPVVF